MLQRIGIRMIYRIKNLRVGQDFNVDLKRKIAFIKAVWLTKSTKNIYSKSSERADAWDIENLGPLRNYR